MASATFIRCRRTPLAWLEIVAFVTVTGCSVRAPQPSEPHANNPTHPTDASTLPAWSLDRSTFDLATSPCDDFYTHVCGGWVDDTELPEGRDTITRADEEVRARTQQVLQSLLDGNAAHNADLRQIQSFQAACLRAETEDPQGERTVRAWLARVEQADDGEAIAKVLGDFHRHGIDAFFAYSVVPDPAKPSRYRGQLQQGRLSLGANASADEVRSLEAEIRAALVRSGLDEATATKRASGVAKLEARLAGAALSWEANEFPSSATEHPMTLEQLEHAAPGFDWAAHFARLGIATERPINVKSIDYLVAVGGAWSNASPAELRAYLRWQLLDDLGAALPPGVRPGGSEPRAEYCERALVRALGVELSRQFSMHALGAAPRDAAIGVAKSIQADVVERVSQTDWLSAAARTANANKVGATDLKLGFPSVWPETAAGDWVPDSHVDAVLAGRAYERAHNWEQLEIPRSRESWDLRVRPNGAFGMAAARLTIPNGFPDQFSNSIVLTAAALQPPLFDGAAPPEVQYATLGTLVAHELIHVVENYEYDAHGVARRLWSDADLSARGKRAECVVAQANAFVVLGEMHVNGVETSDENAADLGGLRSAYDTMAAKLGDSLGEEREGLTPQQRFFYAYAQRWCTLSTPEYQAMALEADWHAPPPFRVNGPLANMPEFAEAFSCPPEAPMARDQAARCTVW